MDKYTYIICGKLYNGIDEEFKEGYKILVKNKKIEAIGRDIPQPETAEVIDLSDATVTPGYAYGLYRLAYNQRRGIHDFGRSKNHCDHPNCAEDIVQRLYDSQTSGRNYFQWIWSSGCEACNRKGLHYGVKNCCCA